MSDRESMAESEYSDNDSNYDGNTDERGSSSESDDGMKELKKYMQSLKRQRANRRKTNVEKAHLKKVRRPSDQASTPVNKRPSISLNVSEIPCVVDGNEPVQSEMTTDRQNLTSTTAHDHSVTFDERLSERLDSIEKMQKELLDGQNKIVKLLQPAKHSAKVTSSKVEVPHLIRTAVHDGYSVAVDMGLSWKTDSGELESGIKRVMKPTSDENKAMTKQITEYVVGIHPGTTDIIVREAIKRYFQTCKDKAHRVSKGKTETFKQGMVMYQRKKRKMEARKSALKKKVSWPEEKKAKFLKVMKIDYMSSEYEQESENEELYEVRNLSWRSKELTEGFLELDAKYANSKSKRSRRQSVKRVRSSTQSHRKPPSDISEDIKWAISESNPEKDKDI